MDNLKKTLLLNSNYEVLSFISEKRAIRLLIKEKVEILSVWGDEKIYFASGSIRLPAILRLKYFVKRKQTRLIFSRKLVMKRDQFMCQYCSVRLPHHEITIDHVVPKYLGGETSFTNCVAACFKCNITKSNRTPEQANMQLLNKPIIPNKYFYFMPDKHEWHDDWKHFLKF